MIPLTPEAALREALTKIVLIEAERATSYPEMRDIIVRAILPVLAASPEPRIAHSKSEYRRLTAQGVNVQPPAPEAETPAQCEATHRCERVAGHTLPTHAAIVNGDMVEWPAETRERPAEPTETSDGAYLWDRCYACGHRLRFAATGCPQCSELFDGRDDPASWPEYCLCDRCEKARTR